MNNCLFNINGLCEAFKFKECESVRIARQGNCKYVNLETCLYYDDNECTCNEFEKCHKIRVEGQNCFFVDCKEEYM